MPKDLNNNPGKDKKTGVRGPNNIEPRKKKETEVDVHGLNNVEYRTRKGGCPSGGGGGGGGRGVSLRVRKESSPRESSPDTHGDNSYPKGYNDLEPTDKKD